MQINFDAIEQDRKHKKKVAQKNYKVLANGTDAIIYFSKKYRDMTISDINIAAPHFLTFIVENKFPEELQEICRIFLEDSDDSHPLDWE